MVDPGRATVVKITDPGGWCDVFIGRPSIWGNRYTHLAPGSNSPFQVETREQAVEAYREELRQRVRDGEPGIVENLAAMHGKRLGCYCYPQACHGDVLADAAAWAWAKLYGDGSDGQDA